MVAEPENPCKLGFLIASNACLIKKIIAKYNNGRMQKKKSIGWIRAYHHISGITVTNRQHLPIISDQISGIEGETEYVAETTKTFN